MTLTGMLWFDKNALICDLAETYGIYDYKSLPVQTAAILAAGLREDSRIKTRMRGSEYSTETAFLLATVIDRITDVLGWFGAYEENKRPESAIKSLMGIAMPEEKPKGLTSEEFDKKHAEMFGV